MMWYDTIEASNSRACAKKKMNLRWSSTQRVCVLNYNKSATGRQNTVSDSAVERASSRDCYEIRGLLTNYIPAQEEAKGRGMSRVDVFSRWCCCGVVVVVVLVGGKRSVGREIEKSASSGSSTLFMPEARELNFGLSDSLRNLGKTRIIMTPIHFHYSLSILIHKLLVYCKLDHLLRLTAPLHLSLISVAPRTSIPKAPANFL